MMVLSHKLAISDTGRMKSEKSLYHRRRFPKEIIRHTVWLYYRFCLSYRPAHRDLMPDTLHDTRQYVNNLAERSHERIRERERRMRRFKSIRHAQLFLSVHGTMQDLFTIPRHLLRATHYRTFRAGAFDLYEQVTSA